MFAVRKRYYLPASLDITYCRYAVIHIRVIAVPDAMASDAFNGGCIQ